ncbi:MAG: mandelate racemase/muconate lactonizing enzyme family protein [Geminicoccaceae bacterium]
MEARLQPITLAKLDVTVYRAPIEQPVKAAFGMMTNRPAVIVNAVEQDGTVGYGEIWSNFPQCGAEHRARLALSACAPLVIDKTWTSPIEAFDHLSERLRALAIQAGEPGPISQAIAGIDTALWDLAAKREGLPLWRLLGGEGDGRVPAYASGINPEGSLEQAERAKADGYQAFKLKIGFDQERDLSNLKALRECLGPDALIMVDANQAYDLDEAVAMSERLASYQPAWLEELLPADSPIDDWKKLRDMSPIPLAAGENIRGDAAFDEVIAAGIFKVIQPDLAKWGGISKGLPLAKRIWEGGARYCPHYLGGGIGLLASAHLLAAAGGDGVLEIDSNRNPLREGLAKPYPALIDGDFVLSDAPGLGVTPDPLMGCYALPVLA